MTFTETFTRFVCEGDAIHCEKEGFHVTARIVRDDCPDAPDERQDGFWPSLYKDAPGFIGPGKKFRQRFEEAQARADLVRRGVRKLGHIAPFNKREPERRVSGCNVIHIGCFCAH